MGLSQIHSFLDELDLNQDEVKEKLPPLIVWPILEEEKKTTTIRHSGLF